MEQLEYLAIVGIPRNDGCLVVDNSRWLHHFTETGVQIEISSDFDPNALAKEIVHLGAEGWEMVGCANLGAKHMSFISKDRDLLPRILERRRANQGDL